MLLVMLLFLPQSGDAATSAIENRNYLAAAQIMREPALTLSSPTAVRRYVVLVSEYYAHQVAFLTFFMKDMLAGDRLDLLRSDGGRIDGERVGRLVEDNLADLLARAEHVFPDSLEIRFARANYIFRGQCCLVSTPKNHGPKEILATFRAAEKQGIVSAGSLWAMALANLQNGNPDPTETSSFIKRSHELLPGDLDVYLAYVNDLISQGDHNNALTHARTVLDLALTPEHKTDALAAIARLMAARDDCRDALIAVNKGLEVIPQHSFLWLIGLDCLRAGADEAAYVRHIRTFLDQDPNKPALFRSYLDYLRIKGVTPRDERFLAGYARVEAEKPLARITQLTNLATYHLFRNQKQEARIYVELAQETATRLTDPPPALGRVLAALAAQTERP